MAGPSGFVSFVKSNWKVILIISAVVVSFLLNDSFWSTIHHKSMISEAQEELLFVEKDIQEFESRLKGIKTLPSVKEHLVRTELGYLKPGEKEVRFNTKP